MGRIRSDGKGWVGLNDDPADPAKPVPLSFIVAGMIVAIVLLWFFVKPHADILAAKPHRPPRTVKAVPSIQAPIVPDYRVLDEKVHDAPNKTMVVVTIIVTGRLSEAGLAALLSKIHFQTTGKTGFRYHETPTNVYIYAATDIDRAASYLWIARSEWNVSESRPTISVNQNQLAQRDVPGETKAGLSEQKRREIWKEIVWGEDVIDATLEAGNVIARTEALGRQLAGKYGVSPDTIKAIKIEALQKEWPLPPER